MTDSRLELSIALSDNERTRPLIEGRVVPQGIKLVPTMVHPSEMFWRQLRFAEFDVSEMSMSSLIISVSRDDTRWVAIPMSSSNCRIPALQRWMSAVSPSMESAMCFHRRPCLLRAGSSCWLPR